MNKNTTEFTVIIPFYVNVDRFYSDLIKFNNLYKIQYEILVVHDLNTLVNTDYIDKVKNLRYICSNVTNTGPAEKRDLASRYAKGKYLAFIDDDAYPDKDWLVKARDTFLSNDNIVAIGGPGITPKEDSFLEQVSGKIYESYFCSGEALNRFLPIKYKEIDDWPAYNLIVTKKAYNQVNGFGIKYYGGEDTFLCMKLNNIGKIVYDPRVLVYHHRRPVFIKLLKQIYNIGKHRGYFFKVYPKTSRRIFYIIPTFLTFSLITLMFISFFNINYFIFTLVISTFVFFLGFLSIGNLENISLTRNIYLKFLGTLGIIGVHISYGIAFIEGLLTTNLER